MSMLELARNKKTLVKNAAIRALPRGLVKKRSNKKEAKEIS